MAATIKKRGGGKKKTLFQTRCTPLVDVKNCNLDAMLSKYEKVIKAILKDAGLPDTFPEIIEHTNNYDLPNQVSYAADILSLIYDVRELVKRGDAENAAYLAVKMGFYIASSDAELIRASRSTRDTTGQRAKKIEKTGVAKRQKRMKEIAIEKDGWDGKTHLTNDEYKVFKAIYRRQFPANNKPTYKEISRDAIAIKLRPKRK